VIDTHCHLLPDIDDGARSDAEALRLARRLVADGVTTVVCTPHFSEQYPTPVVVAQERHERLRHELDLVGIPLLTEVAAELSPGYALETPLERLRPRAISGRYLLVELVARTPPGTALELCARLVPAGFVPVLAHPERSMAVQADPTQLEHAKQEGALVQVVAPSLSGLWGNDVWKTAWDLIESGIADLVASDAHRVSATSPQFGSVASLVESRCGLDRRRELTELVPRRLLAPS
jgi:protein-tyrosine phosphatase